MPMGYKNAMGLVQYLHRRMPVQGLQPPLGLPQAREIRKDRGVPALRVGGGMRDVWQVYCDDADYAEKVERRACEPHSAAGSQVEESGDDGRFAQAARAKYRALDVPLSKKNGTRVSHCQRLGACADGCDGRVVAPAARAGLAVQLTLHLLRSKVSRKDVQVVAGHWCHLDCFRRECSCVFTRVWKLINAWTGPPRQYLFPAVGAELFLALCLLPLHQFDLRCPVSPLVTFSGASETGRGVCWSNKLRPSAVAPSLADLCQGRATGRDEVGLAELFSGIGGGRMAFDRLGIEVAAHATAELLPEARRVSHQQWPSAIELGDVTKITLNTIKAAMSRAPHLRVPFVLGGSPCQGVARINACGQAFTLGENVSSMTAADRGRFSQGQVMGVVPVELRAGGCSLVKRPRLYWVDWPLGPETSEFQYQQKDEVTEAVLTGSWPSWAEQLEQAGLGVTDQASRERWAADKYRYPPYQYRRDNLVEASAASARTWESGAKHKLRPLTSRERAVRLGFHWNHCSWAVPKSESGSIDEDVKCSLLGNSFSVPATPDQVRRALCESLVRSAIFKGRDVRAATGGLWKPAGWPRRGVDADRWLWRACLSFKQGGAHINVLELQALLTAVSWRMRGRANIRTRFIHFCDSQVSIAVACKGRSQSRQLQSILMRLNALLLATSSHPFWVFVRSELNPADAPSRWWQP
ncbi:unnamed protein product [Prorocentrum cordatum]|uniref:DNA (cytosine-5-)-methyltransferase n=1 Tax=Prorocentrum cordatum TaxID=2364126 RepID=A0ABN9Y094_9DINO|nr:unnamed protein product [Polarella glacialis]